MLVDDDEINIRPLVGWKMFEETFLEGSISGTITTGRIFKTVSGNIYEVTDLTLQLVLELQPSTIVLKRNDSYMLIVEGFDEPLICKRLGYSGSSSSGKCYTDMIMSPTPFMGANGEIFKLSNGTIWEIKYEYYPSITACPEESFIIVDGKKLTATRLR